MRACLCVVVLVIGSAPARADDKPEPKYKNHPLAFWVERLQKASTDAEQQEAATAIATFGPDAATAVPVLVGMLDDRSWAYCEMITRVLCAIGPAAKTAVPELVKLLNEKRANDPEHVIRVLAVIGPDAKEAVTVLTTFLANRELSDSAVKALCAIGPAAKGAFPAMQKVVLEIAEAKEKQSDRYYRHGELCFRSHCLESLAGLGEEAVPILFAMLDSSENCAAVCSLVLFAKLGPNGIKAAPRLREHLKHKDPYIRYLAAAALWKITKSAEVVPVLVQLLQPESNSRATDGHYTPPLAHAVWLLEEMGPGAKDALPALRALLDSDANLSPLSRNDVEVAISRIEAKPQK
jgi:HEAT repeat protein